MALCGIWIFIALCFSRQHFPAAEYGVLSPRNLALNKFATQSSGRNADHAVNGHYDDFSATEELLYNWWLVDLKRIENITIIKVHHPRNCCTEGTPNISILTTTESTFRAPQIQNSKWVPRYFQREPTNSFSVQHFNSKIEARFVGVLTLDRVGLKLAEVEIFDSPETVNVARGKPAWKSFSESSASVTSHELIDGSYDNHLLRGGKGETYQHWHVDLGFIATIQWVRIHSGPNLTDDDQTSMLFRARNLSSEDWHADKYLNGSSPVFAFVFSAAKEIAVTSQQLGQHLKLAEVEIFVELNQAFGKPTLQSSTEYGNISGNAVNGFNHDFTFTHNEVNPWWMVDLLDIFTIDRITILSQETFRKRLMDVSIYTTKKREEPIDFNEWTLRDYREGPYGVSETINITSPNELQYIAIKRGSNYSAVLSLAEVIVKEYNFAQDFESASQDSTYGDLYDFYGATQAMDNNIRTLAITNYYLTTQPWWSLKLAKTILMTSVRFHIQRGTCHVPGRRERVPCRLYCSRILIKTNRKENSTTPLTAENSNWRLCYTLNRVGITWRTLHIVCNRNYRQPLTKHLFIAPTTKGNRIALEEINIYGRQLPELSPNSVSIHPTSFTLITLSIEIWNITNTGAFAPTHYHISFNNSESPRVLPHKRYLRAGRISIRWNFLSAGNEYNYSITCFVNDVKCPGEPVSGITRTQPCSAPSIPTFQWKFVENEVPENGLNITVDTVAKHNCERISTTQVILQAEDGLVHYSRSGESHFITVIPKDISHTLTVLVTNNAGLTSSAQKIFNATEVVPDKPQLVSSNANSSCIQLTLTSPSLLSFRLLNLKISCTKAKKYLDQVYDIRLKRTITANFCELPQKSVLLCEATIENSIGISKSLYLEGSPTDIEPTTETPIGYKGLVWTVAVIFGMFVVTLAICGVVFWPSSAVPKKPFTRHTSRPLTEKQKKDLQNCISTINIRSSHLTSHAHL